MANTWDGVFIRCKLGQDATIPKAVAASSPDLICAGTVPFEDPSQLTTEANYGNGYENKVYINAWNYIYMRGKNYADATRAGSWQCFYVPSNIILLPVLWKDNQMTTSNGDKSPTFSIESGKIGASEDSFVWEAAPLDPGQHYCLIGYSVTPEHGDPFMGITKITDWAKALSENGNLAQRNVNMIYSDTPTFTGVAGYYQGDAGATMDLALVFRNIPTGSKISVGFSKPLNGKTLSYKNDQTVDVNFKYAWVDQDVPAQWSANFNFTIWLGDGWEGITGKPSLEIRGELVQASTDPLYYLGTEPELDKNGNKRLDKVGEPVRIIRVGSVISVCENTIP
jgi:hypothetical protein